MSAPGRGSPPLRAILSPPASALAGVPRPSSQTRAGELRAKWGEAVEVYQFGVRGIGGKPSSGARNEIGVRSIMTPGLEGILKSRWENVAVESPPVIYHPSCPWRVT